MAEIVLPECKPKEIDLVVIPEDQFFGIGVELVATLVVGGLGLYFALLSGPWQAGLLFLLLLARFWQRSSQISWNLVRISVSRDGLRVARQGRTVRSILFEDIGTVQLGVKGELFWFRILLRSGEVALELPTTHHIVRRLHAIRSIIRQVRPRLSEDVTIVRATSPENNFDAVLIASAFYPERIIIRPGVTYRYRAEEELQKYLQTLRSGVGHFSYAVVFAASLTLANDHGMAPTAYCGLIASIVLLGEVVTVKCFGRSCKDTFCFEPDGTLVVTRKGWVRRFRTPSVATGWRGALRIVDAPVIRYGSWMTAYYFDPRLIEEVH